MRNGSIWSDVVFEKEVIFHEFDFETSEFDFEVSKSSIWKQTTSCDKGVFFFGQYYLATSTTNWDIHFHRYVTLCIWWDTVSGKTGIWQLPKVTSAFRVNVRKCRFVYWDVRAKVVPNLHFGVCSLAYSSNRCTC